MRPVVMSGFMGTGKTTIAPRVAARLGVPFVDTDAEIERAAGASIREIWDRDGEAAFHLSLATDRMPLEAAIDAVASMVRRDPLVVPLGGRSYAIDVCVDEPLRLTEAVQRCTPSSIVVVSDSHVWRARAEALTRALRDCGRQAAHVALAPGEENKTLASVATIWDAALGGQVDRDAVVI